MYLIGTIVHGWSLSGLPDIYYEFFEDFDDEDENQIGYKYPYSGINNGHIAYFGKSLNDLDPVFKSTIEDFQIPETTQEELKHLLSARDCFLLKLESSFEKDEAVLNEFAKKNCQEAINELKSKMDQAPNVFIVWSTS